MKEIIASIIYSPNYDIRIYGIEKLHAFDSCKYSRIWHSLEKNFGDKLKDWTVNPKRSANHEEISGIHSESYLETLKNSTYLAKALGLEPLSLLPAKLLDKHLLEPMRWAVMGTIVAAEQALKTGISINLSGGYHHASRDKGEGFCIYSDIAIAISYLFKSGNLQSNDEILIIDLDAHQGNGLERIFQNNKNVHILDMYNEDIYPQDQFAKQYIDCNVPLSSGLNDEAYLEKLTTKLPEFLRKYNRVKIAFYNAGTDIYVEDPLGKLNISSNGVLERDKFVFNTLTEANIPWVMTLSGGYTRESYKLVTNSIDFVLRKWR